MPVHEELPIESRRAELLLGTALALCLRCAIGLPFASALQTAVSQRFPLRAGGRSVETRAERTCDAFGGAGGTFQTVARRQVPTVRKRRTPGDAKRPGGRPGSVHRTTEMRSGPASGGGWESVHRTTLATLDEQSRRQVGPQNSVRPPPPEPSVPASNKFPRGAGPAGIAREVC